MVELRLYWHPSIWVKWSMCFLSVFFVTSYQVWNIISEVYVEGASSRSFENYYSILNAKNCFFGTSVARYSPNSKSVGLSKISVLVSYKIIRNIVIPSTNGLFQINGVYMSLKTTTGLSWCSFRKVAQIVSWLLGIIWIKWSDYSAKRHPVITLRH